MMIDYVVLCCSRCGEPDGDLVSWKSTDNTLMFLCDKCCKFMSIPYPPVPVCPYCSKEMLEDPVDPGWYCEKGFGCHGPTNGVHEFTRRKEE